MNNENFYSDKHLTREELVEYSQGNLSNSEMHRLEVHLVSCELCNESLEGIKELDDPQELEALTHKVIAAVGVKEAKGLAVFHYVAIAASVLLIAVLGFIFTRSAEDVSGVEIAAQESATDSGMESIGKSGQPAEPVEDQKETDTLVIALTETAGETGTTAPVAKDTMAKGDQQITEPGAFDPDNLLAQSPAEEDSTTIIADLDTEVADSLFQLQQDSVVIAAEVPAEELQMLEVASKAAVPQANEAKRAVTEAEAEGIYVPAEPEKGMRAYRRYLRKNMVYPTAADENNIVGDVELLVTINIDGTIGKIEVSNSLGYGCDEEAIRLIRQGGDWTAGTQGGIAIEDQVSITVSFKR